MAFDRPIEADSVDDLGLLSSLIRAPVVGIMWLLGGDHDEDAKSKGEGGAKQVQDAERVEGEASGDSCNDDNTGKEKEAESTDGRVGSSGRGAAGTNDGDPLDRYSSAAEAEGSDHDKENRENESPSLPKWPSVRFSEKSIVEDSSKEAIQCPASPRMDDLVTAMEGSHISPSGGKASPGPATSAVLSSQGNMPHSSAASFPTSYSASTFSDHRNASRPHLSQSFTNNNSISSIKSNKKMSWSDECGNRSLVEYFDDSAISRSKHWSAMRRNNSWKTSRRNSFDVNDKGAAARRGEVRVIKSALKRSGSYSPPVTYFAGGGLPPSMSSSTDTSSTDSSHEMKSFRSISVIASSDSSRSNSSDLSKESDTSDSMAAVTQKKLNANEVQCVPSTLQVGSGRGNGGLIIPRGGPTDSRYYFPRGGPNDPRYQLILGTSVPSGHEQKAESSDEQGQNAALSNETGGISSSPAAPAFPSGVGSPGHHHHFLPRPTPGHISPQYGFYVNITPPTPEMYHAARNPGDKAARSAMQQQSYHQFYQHPTPIPEEKPGLYQGMPQRFVGRSSVPRPSSKRSSEQRDQLTAEMQNSLKPTFTKNKKGMGMILAENPHHGVWPTVPFG